ncbi:MAG TPA: LPS export ABC transporter periplasmic protein LptC [Flavipsychrobacter sp.]|nr:LPS export ABC transporter periplasmic protein LptC [Flavipsychrobacter sp.]
MLIAKHITKLTRTLLPGILLFAMVIGCKNDPKEINALVTKGAQQEDKAEDVTILYSDNGNVKMRLYAKEFVKNDVAKPPYTDMRKGLKVEFYGDSLKVESTLTARYARYYEKQGNILIRDSIVIVNKKGEKLNTEELVWNQSAKKLFTEKFVKITTPTQVMYGDGLEANEDFTWYRILNPKGIVAVDKKEIPE